MFKQNLKSTNHKGMINKYIGLQYNKGLLFIKSLEECKKTEMGRIFAIPITTKGLLSRIKEL